MVVIDSIRLTLAGLAIGTLVSLVSTRALRGMLVGVAATDPVTFGALTGILLLVAPRCGRRSSPWPPSGTSERDS